MDYDKKKVMVDLNGWAWEAPFEQLVQVTDPEEFVRNSFRTLKMTRAVATVFMIARDQLMEEGLI